MADQEKASQATVLTELGLGNDLKPSESNSDSVVEKAVEPSPAPRSEAPKEPEQPVVAETKPADEPAKDERVVKLEKQLKDTRDAFTQERQVNKQLLAKQEQLAKQVEVLIKKVDGTYDEAKDAPKLPTADQVVDEAKRQQRIQSSHKAAVKQYGEEYVMKTVWADDAPFRKFDADPKVQQRVMESDVPILEAIEVVKEAETKAKYGDNPDAMLKALEKELTPKIEKKVRSEFEKKGFTFEGVNGLSGVPSASTERATPQIAEKSFDSLFPNFAKSAG